MKLLASKILLIVVVMGSFFSCSDLEEKPVGLLAPEGLFSTIDDVQAAVFGGFGALASEPLWGRQFFFAIELRSDMTDIGDRGTPAARQQVNDFNMDDRNGMVDAFWPMWYMAISAANTAIAGADQLDVAESELSPVVAEARFIRAFSYYHLVRVFGAIPYIDFSVTDPSSVADISRTPADDVYAGIIADLEFAKQWLPDRHSNNIRSRPTKGTAASYLASLYLTRGDYQSAYEEAKWVIDNRDRFGYVLEADYQDLFRAEIADNLREPIFTLDFLGLQGGPDQFNVDYLGSMTGIRGADRTGWSVAVPSMAVYDTWDPRDYRKVVSLADSVVIGGVMRPYTDFANTPRPHIAKYFRYPGNAQEEYAFSDHNLILMRYADILLIAAEALTEISGRNAEAAGYVNQIRERARNWAGVATSFPANVDLGLSKEAFINLILEERRLELCFEGHRWYDIQRRRLGDEAFKGPNSLEPHSNFDASRDYLMPISRRDIDINPNLLPQNPGY